MLIRFCLVFIFLLSASLFSIEPNQKQKEFWEYLQLLEDQIHALEQNCYKENQFLDYYEFYMPLPSGEQVFASCNQFKDFLIKEIAKLQTEFEAYDQNTSAMGPVCPAVIHHLPINSWKDLSIIQTALKDKMLADCVNNASYYVFQCVRDELCDVYASLISAFDSFVNSLWIADTTYNKTTQAWETHAKLSLRKLLNENSCGYKASGASDCFHIFAQGVLKNIVMLLDSAKSLGHFLIFGEDKMSTLLHILRAFANPVDLGASIARDYLGLVREAVIYHFGCDQWESDNFLNRGKCLKPDLAWKCMDCDQQLNVMCGLMGSILGQPLSSYIIGRISGSISGGLEVTKIASTQVKKIFDAVGRGKGWFQARHSMQYLKSKMKIAVPTALGKIPSPQILQKYQSAVKGAFEDGFIGGKHSVLKLSHKLGTSGYQQAFFVNKMIQHRLEVKEVGREFILEKFKNSPGIDAKKLADDYVKYIDAVHDADKLLDPRVRAALAKTYGKHLVSQEERVVVNLLNQLEDQRRVLYVQQAGLGPQDLKIIREVEKYSDLGVRSYGNRDIVVNSVPGRYSDEFGRPTYPFVSNDPHILNDMIDIITIYRNRFPSLVAY